VGTGVSVGVAEFDDEGAEGIDAVVPLDDADAMTSADGLTDAAVHAVAESANSNTAARLNWLRLGFPPDPRSM
jgi:hypothetical protein